MNDLHSRSPKPKFKVAVLDKNGKIIQTSQPFELENDTGYLYGYVNYDLANNTIELEWEKNRSKIEIVIFIIIASVMPVVLAAKIGLLFVNRKKRKEFEKNKAPKN